MVFFRFLQFCISLALKIISFFKKKGKEKGNVGNAKTRQAYKPGVTVDPWTLAGLR
jgi:hypothetical protein